MGNAVSPCFVSISISRRRSSAVNLIFSDGFTRTLAGKHHMAGEIMFQFPHMMVCHADSFFIGQPVPCLEMDDELGAGENYLVLPMDMLASIDVVSTSSLASLGARNAEKAVKFSGPCPFKYVQGGNGRVMIKVLPEFILRLVSDHPAADEDGGEGGKFLCSTPELKKHYDELVGSSKGQVWSPKLETISECNIKHSPPNFVGLKSKHRQKPK